MPAAALNWLLATSAAYLILHEMQSSLHTIGILSFVDGRGICSRMKHSHHRPIGIYHLQSLQVLT